MIQSTNSHVRRLLSEKAQYEDELQKAKEIMKGRMQGILIQCKYQYCPRDSWIIKKGLYWSRKKITTLTYVRVDLIGFANVNVVIDE